MNSNNKILLDAYMKRELNAHLHGKPAELTEEEAAKYHPANDIVFLERLDADAIDDRERTELLEHLDQCAYCRQAMEQLCRSGALFAQASGKKDIGLSWDRIPGDVKKHVKPLALAACVLLVAGIGILYSLPSGNPSQVAYNKVRKMLDTDEKGFSTSLPENGYRMNGTSAMKAFPVMDDHKREVRTAYEKLIADYPDNVSFRTEFGKYLLFVLKEPDLARNELEKSLEASLSPSELHRFPELRLLLGIAAFEEGNDTAAQEQFRSVLDLDPKNLDAKVNLAICLYRSGETENATEMFEELRKESIPAQLRDRIEEFLNR